MENSAEALKLAGFTFLFVAALSIAMMTIMQAKRTSEQIITYSDKTNYSSTIQENNNYENGNRIVSVYDIIPTLYRYNQEKYIVLFFNTDGSPLEVFEGDLNTNNKNVSISYLNGELESDKKAQWLTSTTTVKQHVGEIVKNLLDMQEKNPNIRYVEGLYTTTNAYENNSGDQNIPIKDSDTSIKVITYKQKQ